MTTAAQFEWTEDRNPEAGEFTSSRKPWNAITEFTFNDLDHNGVPFDLAQVLDGERLNLAAHKGAAEYTVISVNDRTVTVAPIYGYGDPIPGTVTTITTRAEGDFDYDDTALIARIAAEEKKRAEEDALLQQQIDGKADQDHIHDETGVADHNHDTAYAPTVHDHNQYSVLAHSHNEFNHNHDTAYAPTVHQHPHGHTEFTDLEDKDKEQDERLDALEASGTENGQDLTHDHEGQYAPVHDHPYAKDEHGHSEYFPKGNAVDDDGNPLPLPYPDANSLGSAVNGKADEHGHPYVKTDADTDIKPTADNRFINLVSKRPKEEDGSYADKEFGLAIDIDEGNTWKNQFEVGNRHGFALKVTGGSGRSTWVGGKITQKGDSLENEDARDYIVRKNLNDAVDPLVEKIEHNEDLINALEHELDAIAETKEAGEWELVPILDFDVRGTGQMTLSNSDFTASSNELTLHETDKNGVSHGFSGVEPGDLVEVVEEHEARSTGDYGLYEVKSVNGMSFTLELQQGRGQAVEHKNFFVKFFHLSDDVNIAELDARYALKEHTHPPAPAPTQPPGRPFIYGKAEVPGEFHADNEGNVYLNCDDLNGNRRVMTRSPDFTWSTPCKITMWTDTGVLWYACEAGKTTEYTDYGEVMVFKNANLRYTKSLSYGATYYISVEGYW